MMNATAMFSIQRSIKVVFARSRELVLQSIVGETFAIYACPSHWTSFFFFFFPSFLDFSFLGQVSKETSKEGPEPSFSLSFFLSSERKLLAFCLSFFLSSRLHFRPNIFFSCAQCEVHQI
jgi:hypothetical protein